MESVTSLIVLIVIFSVCSKIFSSFSGVVSKSGVDRGDKDAAQARASLPAPERRSPEIASPQSAKDAPADINDDPCVAVPFRGGPVGMAPTTAQSCAADDTSEAAVRVQSESQVDALPAVCLETTVWGYYDSPAVFRANPQWRVRGEVPEYAPAEIGAATAAPQWAHECSADDWATYAQIMIAAENDAPCNGFMKPRNSGFVALGQQAQMELPLTRH